MYDPSTAAARTIPTPFGVLTVAYEGDAASFDIPDGMAATFRGEPLPTGKSILKGVRR